MATVINFLKNLGLVKLLAIGASILAFIILIAAYLYTVSSSPSAVLYSDLSNEDSAEVIEQLELQNIKYELVAGGSIIKVNEDLVLKLRINMAKKGLPNKGSLIGYEIFDKDENLGTTSFTQNIKMVRALEGELSRTIKSITGVQEARVHLVLPRKEIFSRDKQGATASIMIKIPHNISLKKSEIIAISHLVATAVPQLNPKDITIVDNHGHSLQLGGESEDNNYHSDSNEEFRLACENKLKRNAEGLLEKSLGNGKVKVSVNADMDFNRITISEEVYDPDNSAIRSTHSSEEQERTPIKNDENSDMSVANNLPDFFSNNEASSNSFATINKNDETTNYEVSKTIKNQIRAVGVIEKLSVSVLVDGNYTTDADGNAEYYPRSKEEMLQIEKLVKTAVGFDKERGDQMNVVNMKFVSNLYDFKIEDEMMSWVQQYLPTIIQMVLLAITVVLIFIYVIKPITLQVLSNKNIGDEKRAVEQIIQNTTGEKDGDSSTGQTIAAKSSASINLSNIIKNNPEEALSILRRWIRE